MRKSGLLTICGGLLLSAMIMTGCNNKEKEVKDFTERFAGFVEDNERDSILAYYPKAELMDTLKLDYDPKTVKIEQGDKEGVYIVNFDDETDMKVKVGDKGKIKILESNGLLKVSPGKLKFAKNTGALKGVENDADLAKRLIIVDNMSTDLFNKYVEKRKNAIKNLGYTETYTPMYGMDEGKGYYTLRNMTDEPISGSEYNITWHSEWFYADLEDSKNTVEPGVDIPANGTAKVPASYTMHYEKVIKAITMNTPSQEDFFSKYQPTGDEYADYVAVHGDDVEVGEKVGNGPFDFAGVIGKNMKIHMHLDKGMKEGSYYYDKNGSKSVLTLKVKGFNRNTGEITLEEYDKKGVITGNFVGKIVGKNFTGTMTAHSGKSYSFDLKVQ